MIWRRSGGNPFLLCPIEKAMDLGTDGSMFQEDIQGNDFVTFICAFLWHWYQTWLTLLTPDPGSSGGREAGRVTVGLSS